MRNGCVWRAMRELRGLLKQSQQFSGCLRDFLSVARVMSELLCRCRAEKQLVVVLCWSRGVKASDSSLSPEGSWRLFLPDSVVIAISFDP